MARIPSEVSMNRRLGLLFLGLCAGASAPVRAASPVNEWPQWRGPARDGRLSGLPARASWPETLAPAWKLEVGSGHSSPVVSADRVYEFSREAEAEVVRALDHGGSRATRSRTR
jgi:hypothetical protein